MMEGEDWQVQEQKMGQKLELKLEQKLELKLQRFDCFLAKKIYQNLKMGMMREGRQGAGGMQEGEVEAKKASEICLLPSAKVLETHLSVDSHCFVEMFVSKELTSEEDHSEVVEIVGDFEKW